MQATTYEATNTAAFTPHDKELLAKTTYVKTPVAEGDLEKGVTLPEPRFKDNVNGTVTDNLTGLIWLKNANCFGEKTWNQSLLDVNGLASGTCGLTDGSSAGNWRLPNRKEFFSLVDDGVYSPALPDTAGTVKWSAGNPFTNVYTDYWSSTTFANTTSRGWGINTIYGNFTYGDKSYTGAVWPVRGGQ